MRISVIWVGKSHFSFTRLLYMSIATRTGDAGTTALMYNRRLSKCHPQVEAYGSVDELNSALGSVRSLVSCDFVRGNVLAVQRQLVTLMGELATAPEDLGRYVQGGFQIVTPSMTVLLDELVRDIESRKVSFKGWATPGETPLAAALDVARTTCRRAERRVCALKESQTVNAEILIYLNRLSDVLWLMARWVETEQPANPESLF
jgi:cob(I)alamin adenosyltransferase